MTNAGIATESVAAVHEAVRGALRGQGLHLAGGAEDAGSTG